MNYTDYCLVVISEIEAYAILQTKRDSENGISILKSKNSSDININLPHLVSYGIYPGKFRADDDNINNSFSNNNFTTNDVILD